MTRHTWQKTEGALTFNLPKRAIALCIALGLALALLLLGSLWFGSYPLTAPDIWLRLSGAVEDAGSTIVWQIRLPRVLAAASAGALLALSGAILQGVTRNPIADPSLIGVSQGAGLAVVTALILFPGANPSLRPVLAFGGAMAATVTIQWLTADRSGRNNMRFILTGVGVAAFLSAVTSALLSYSHIERAQSALSWLAGSVHDTTWTEVTYLVMSLTLVAAASAQSARSLSILRLGPEVAAGLGISVSRSRARLVILSVAAAATAVAATGPIGFAGLLAPHMARRIATSGVGLHLCMTGFLGALIVAAADLLGRTVAAPVQVPAGVVTALIGAPFFLFLMIRGSKERS